MTGRSWVLLGALAALWGASYMFIKIALEDGVPAPAVVFTRIALGALVLVPLALRRRAFAALRGRAGWVIAIAAIQLALPFLLITSSEEWIPSALAGILVASAPIFVAILSPWLDRSDITRGWGIVGIAVGIVGVALLFGVDLSGSSKLALGGAMVVVASIGYALGAIWVRTKLTGAMPVGVAAATLAVAAVLSVPAALATPAPDLDLSPGTVAALFALGAGGTGIAFLLFYILIADVGTTRAAIVAYLAPGFAVLYGGLFLDEQITAATLAGLALILLGSWVAAESRPPWRRRRAGALGPLAEAGAEPLAEDLLAARAEAAQRPR